MRSYRIIPTLLLKSDGLVKGRKFKNHEYVGDPINAVKLFTELGADELCILDIDSSASGVGPNYLLLEKIVSECFVPISYGGGVNSVEVIKKLLSIGIEKVILNTQALASPQFVKEAVTLFGSSTIVVCVDYKKSLLGKYYVFSNCGKINTGRDLFDWVNEVQKYKIGELILSSIDNDGELCGYDFKLLERINNLCNTPLVASGGGRGMSDFKLVCELYGASGAAAGASLIYVGKHRSVLINYPGENLINS